MCETAEMERARCYLDVNVLRRKSETGVNTCPVVYLYFRPVVFCVARVSPPRLCCPTASTQDLMSTVLAGKAVCRSKSTGLVGEFDEAGEAI